MPDVHFHTFTQNWVKNHCNLSTLFTASFYYSVMDETSNVINCNCSKVQKTTRTQKSWLQYCTQIISNSFIYTSVTTFRNKTFIIYYICVISGRALSMWPATNLSSWLQNPYSHKACMSVDWQVSNVSLGLLGRSCLFRGRLCKMLILRTSCLKKGKTHATTVAPYLTEGNISLQIRLTWLVAERNFKGFRVRLKSLNICLVFRASIYSKTKAQAQRAKLNVFDAK